MVSNLFSKAKTILNFKYGWQTMSNQVKFISNKLRKEPVITLNKTDDETAFTIKLNDVNIKTPMKNLLIIKDETLAHAIANEWRSFSQEKKFNLSHMHLTTLAYTAIDNPFNDTPEHLVENILEYLNFDTIRFRDVKQEDLLKIQSKHWDPMIGWFEHKFDCHLPIEYGDIYTTQKIPEITHAYFKRQLTTYDRWPLLGVKFMTENLKSFVLMTSLTERFLKVEQAVELSRLETKFQTEKWSKVEWEHDTDEQCTNVRVAAGSLFYHLNL